MDENNPIKYSDLIQPDSTFDELLALLDELGDRYSSLKAKIVAGANTVKQALQSVNGTTAQGQTIIADQSKEISKLLEQNKKLANAYTAVSKAAIEKNQEISKAKRIVKLEQQMAKSQAGSYDYLSAQYGLLKERLNAMSQAERETTKEGQQLVEQASQIYKQMRMLQEVTGKHTLSVGDYGIATVNLAADIRRAVQALTQMRLEGQEGSAQYNRLVQDLKRLKAQYSIVKTETQSLGSQTATLNQVMGALSATSGVLTSITGLVEEETSNWAAGLLKINKYIAITNGLMAFMNGLYKQSYVTNLLMNVAKKSEIKARALNIAFLRGEVKQTWLLVAAQSALNLIAKANPFVLLGTAIVGVATGISLLTSNTKKANKVLRDHNTLLQSVINYYKTIEEIGNQSFDLAIKADQARIKSLQDTEAGLVAVWEAESKLLDKRQDHANQNASLYRGEVKNLETNKQVLAAYAKELEVLNQLKGAGAKGKTRVQVGYYDETTAAALPGLSVADIFKLDKNKLTVKLDDAIELIQGYVDTYKDKVNIAIGVETDQADLKAEQTAMVTRWRMIQRELTDKELEERHKANVETAKLTTERFAQQALLAKLEYEEEIRLLKQKLERDANLTLEARKAVNEQIIALEGQLQIELGNIYYERLKANKSAQRATEDLETKAIKDGFDKRRQEIITGFAREREDIELELKHNNELTKKEREELRKQLVAIAIVEAKELSDLSHEEALDLLSITRETEDAILNAKTDSYAKQFEQMRVAHEREMEDINDRLVFEGLTEKQREALQAQMVAKEKEFLKERSDLERQYRLALLDNEKRLWDDRRSTLNEYTQDYLTALLQSLNASRKTEIIEYKQQAELLGLTTAQTREGLKAINDKYDDQELQEKHNHMLRLFDLDQELAESEFNITRRSEYEKSRFTRKQEIARLQEILKLNEQFGNKLTEEEVQIIKNRIKALENASDPYENFFDLLGIPAEWKDLLQDWVDTILDAYKEVLDARMELADAQISAAQEELDITKSVLEAELQARANGYASNVALARQEYEEAKKREREALEFRRQVEREQEVVDSITQANSLLTATAQFWSTSSSLGPVAGPIAAALATSTMWAAFIAAKIRSRQLRDQAATYGEGTVELLKGGSHASGNDISLGYTPDGRERRAEGGEYFAIINKRSSQKYGNTVEDVINSLNSGTFEDEYSRGARVIEYPGSHTGEPTAIDNVYTMLRNFVGEFGRTRTTDLSRLEEDVAALRKEMESKEYVDPDGYRVIVRGSNTRRIKNG